MRRLSFCLLMCLVSASIVTAEDAFAPDTLIEAGGEPIDVACFRGAGPFVGDFDGDGLDDLLVGQNLPARLRIYRNVGTREEPRFGDFEWFCAGGEIAELPTEGPFRPQLSDLDGDGELDIISASETGIILWYRRTVNGFTEAQIVRLADGQMLNVGFDAACSVVDWDSDGDNDLIITGQATLRSEVADVYFVENLGAADSLSLAAPRGIELDKGAITGSRREACPVVVDWTRDGKHDLLLGLRNGSVVLYENIGEPHAPQFDKGRVLVAAPIPRGRGNAKDGPRRSWAGGLCVTDWDDDGRLDLLIGDAQRGSDPPDVSAQSAELEAARRRAATTLSDYRRLRRLREALSPDSPEDKRALIDQSREQTGRRLEQLRQEIARLEAATRPQSAWHGYVWLLRQIDPQ